MPVQTVFRAGNSNVVTIPKSIGDKYGIQNGSKVVLEEAPGLQGVIIKKYAKPSKKNADSALDPEFKRWLKIALREDGDILDELANR
ncbi:MAG: AbrB/MazE/SpoVT family DNA-binding domain-containing protein [Candidatus Daviesbacteria bacterium]|nr:AbrB/MazE/SpoVT family DNA-binding domain-containing protein [Candidatus Daviesbacteria bacterium]